MSLVLNSSRAIDLSLLVYGTIAINNKIKDSNNSKNDKLIYSTEIIKYPIILNGRSSIALYCNNI